MACTARLARNAVSYIIKPVKILKLNVKELKLKTSF